MKRAFAVLTASLIAMPAFAQTSDLQADFDAVVASERAFAKLAGEKGIPFAFHQYIADEGIMFTPDPVKAKAQLAEDAAKPVPEGAAKLRWWPVHADVARSGDMGWTTGPWIMTRGDQNRYGNFVTVWKKQPDGNWRWLIDYGITTKEASPLGPDTPVTPLKAGKTRAKAVADVSKQRDSLFAADRQLAEATAKGNLKAAFQARLTDDARFLRVGPQPFVGKAAYTAALDSQPATMTTNRLGGDVSAAGDLGYTYGSAEWPQDGKTEKGYYLRIWNNEGGTWKLALDELIPTAPPPPAPPKPAEKPPGS